MKIKKPKQKRKRRIPEEDRKQRQIIARVTEAEYQALEDIVDREDLPVSYFVREAIQLLIEKKKKGGLV